MNKRVDHSERRRLRLRLALFFAALALPSALLLIKALDQLKWEALRQSQLAAEALTLGIDERLGALIREQDERSFADFAFLTLAGDPSAGFVQRSALSDFPVDSALPGLIGWFQIDAAGHLSTPLLPTAGLDAGAYGIDAAELVGRQALEQRIRAILGSNALVERPRLARTTPGAAQASGSTPAPPAAQLSRGRIPSAEYREEGAAPTSINNATASDALPRQADQAPALEKSQAIFERLSTAQMPGLDETAVRGDAASRRDLADGVRSTLSGASFDQQPRRGARREQAALPEPVAGTAILPSDQDAEMIDESRPRAWSAAAPRPVAGPAPVSPQPLIRTFESELDPFRFNLLDSGHFVLFRWAWRDGARYVQGALLQPDAFLSALIGDAFRASALQRATRLQLAWGDRPLGVYGTAMDRYDHSGAGSLPDGTVVYRGRLQEPFGALRLEFEAARLPSPPGAALIYWLGLVLGLVLAVGTLGLYRLGLRQLGLVRQQQALVAAVSHELKTPLTSIRMYAEMLRAGWVTDAKRDHYYRSIHDESERLSRLVANLLQLARMSRDELPLQPRPLALSELIDRARAALANQAEQAGFELVIDCADDALVSADPDALTQVLINLIDNAIKFSAKASVKRVEIGCWAAAEPEGRRRWYQGWYRGQSQVQNQGSHQGLDQDFSQDSVQNLGQWGLIRIRDHGPGIPKAERRRVFKLFQRLEQESTRDTQGTGIGLALVQRLMRAMNGDVALIGREPGIEVRLWLPPGHPK